MGESDRHSRVGAANIDRAEILAGFISESSLYRATHPDVVGVRYGSSQDENLDIFLPCFSGLKPVYFFDKQTWGRDRFVAPALGYEEREHGFSAEFLSQAPVNEQAKKDLRRLYDPHQPDYLAGLSSAEKKERLARISYNDFLLALAKVDKQVLWFFQTMPTGYFGVGTDATPALFCWEMGLPGFAGMTLQPTPEGVLADLPGGQHGRQNAEGGGGVWTAAVD